MTPPAKKAVPKLSDLGKDNTDNNDEVISEENDTVVTPEDTDVKDNETNNEDATKDDFLAKKDAVAVDKTPNELAAETPDETAARYGIDTKVTEEDIKNPRVQVYGDTVVKQVPSGTHLHPDVAKDLYNRGIAEQSTDNATVKRTVIETYDFAPDAETNDKF